MSCLGVDILQGNRKDVFGFRGDENTREPNQVEVMLSGLIGKMIEKQIHDLDCLEISFNCAAGEIKEHLNHPVYHFASQFF